MFLGVLRRLGSLEGREAVSRAGESAVGELDVAPGRLNRGVAEALLDDRDARAGPVELGRVRVAECMGVELVAEASEVAEPCESELQAAPREPVPVCAEEESGGDALRPEKTMPT